MKYIKYLDKKKWSNSYNALFILCTICVLFITITHVIGSNMLKTLGISLYLFIMIACNKCMILPLSLFFLSWTDIIKLTPDSISFTSVVTLLLIFRFIIEGWRVQPKAFIVTILIALLTLLAKLYHGYEVSTSYIMFFATMILHNFILSNEKEKIQFDKCIYFYSSGLILAALTAIVFQNSQNIGDYIRIQRDSHSVLRVTGFIGDANFYSSQILPAFTGLLLLMWRNNRQLLGNIILAISVAAVGLIAVSKSYFVCLVIVVGCYILSISKRNKKNIYILLAIGLILYFAISISGFFSNTIEAYTTRFTTSTDMKELTTGRDLIWENYLVFFYNHPHELLIGQGMTNVFNIVYKGSHNTILQSFYQFGIVGSILLLYWIYELIKTEKIKHLLWIKLLWIIGCFSMWMGLDLLFFDDFFCVISIYSVGLEEIRKIWYSEIDKPNIHTSAYTK